jgi:signal transduction histidine kinase
MTATAEARIKAGAHPGVVRVFRLKPSSALSSEVCTGAVSLVIVFLLCFGAPSDAQPSDASGDRLLNGPRKRILVLSPFTQGERSVAAVERALHAALVEALGTNLDYNVEHLANYGRDDDYNIAIREYFRRKYAGQPLDVVIPIARVALEFARDHGTDAFGCVQVVALVSADGEETLRAWRAEKPATGIVDALDFKGTLDLILRLQPTTRQVVLIFGASEGDARVVARARRELAHEARVAVRYAVGLPLEELLAEAGRLHADTTVMFVQPREDRDGNLLVPDEVLAQLAAAASVPMYGLRAVQMELGIVGGSVAAPESEGREMAELVLRVLRGERPQDIPVRQTQSMVPMVNGRQLRRWGITESRLPPGTIVQHRDRSPWESDRSYVVGTVAVVAVQMLLLGWLLVERRQRRRAEGEAREHLEKARQHLVAMTHLDRRAAMGEVTAAIAHELNQPIEAILHNAEAGAMMLDAGTFAPEEMREILDDIRRIDMRAGDIIQRMRGLLRKHELEAKAIDVNEVTRETLAIVTPVAAAKGVRLELDLGHDLLPIVGDRIHLQQVLLNLLLNGIDATAAMPRERRCLLVRTAKNGEQVEVSVRDAGHGIPDEAVSRIFEPFYTTKGEGMGIGLSIARTIVEAHGGSIAARNNPEGGATVWFSLPVGVAA